MKNTYGSALALTIFGESHGAAIGAVLDGLAAGIPVDEEFIAAQMEKRRAKKGGLSTSRIEADKVRFLSGVYNGRTTGTAITMVIENTNTRSGDYAQMRARMRPGHADYAGCVKYRGYNDPRGGGHFSGRLTAPLVFAGSIARQLLQAQGVTLGAHIAGIANVQDARFDPVHVEEETLRGLQAMRFPLLEPQREAAMRAAVEAARAEGDSVGGVIECAAVGVRPGIGSPFFGSLESVAGALAFSVPAVKAVEFGDGMQMAAMRASQANDPMRMADGQVRCLSNHNGGVTGGITNGMPVILRAAVKPTPSIARAQQSVDVRAGEDVTLTVTGRHDPCIVPRAVVVIESILAIALCELMMDDAACSALI